MGMPLQVPDARIALVAIVVGFILVVSIAFGLGRCTAPEQYTPIVPADIDAGPGDQAIAERLDGAVVVEDERIAAIEREHRDEIDGFEESDRAAYESTRAQGRDALARWFKDRTRALLEDGGR